MDKIGELNKHPDLLEQFQQINNLNILLESKFLENFNRSLPMSDHINDRWERAKRLGFGEGSNIYDSSYVLGEVIVGKNCWIGMNTILDGTGKLEIGDNCTISAGVQIYTHDNVKATLSGNRLPIERSSVKIGHNSYLAPYTIVSRGITIGNYSIIAAHSFVNRSFPNNAIVAGVPAQQIGEVIIDKDEITFKYSK